MDVNKLKEIIPVLIDKLQAAPEGYRTTTSKLLYDAGYALNDFEVSDLFDIHDALMSGAEKAGMTLDMSAWDNQIAGLPFNLAFILKK